MYLLSRVIPWSYPPGLIRWRTDSRRQASKRLKTLDCVLDEGLPPPRWSWKTRLRPRPRGLGP